MDTVLDPHRLAVLHDLEILDTPPELAYDDIATLAATSTGSAIAAVNFVDGDRHWTKAAVGTDSAHGTSLSADASFCVAMVRSGEDLMCISDTTASDEWRDHPLVCGPPAVRFYAGAAIVVSHQPVGVVCVYGDAPRDFTRRDERALLALARQVASQLELRRRDHRLSQPGLTDPLTGVANRRLLLDRLQIAIAERRRRGSEVGVVVWASEESGHERPELADRYLAGIAAQLCDATREGDTVARSAPDEFTVIVPDLAGQPALDGVVARIREVIQQSGSGVPDGAAPGLRATLVHDGESAASVLRRA